LELAADYLLMAAMLAEIKSRLLLPRPIPIEGVEEQDPRAELVRRLQEYERFKQAAFALDVMPREGRDVFNAQAIPPDLSIEKPKPKVDLRELILAFQEVLKRVQVNAHHAIAKETLSVREKMTAVLDILQERQFTEFTQLFDIAEGRIGVVVTFLAMLELVRQNLIEFIQNEPYSPIHITLVNEQESN
jgi:segregation and condensation protein A